MKAVVYGGPGEKTRTDVPDPGTRNPGGVIVKVEATVAQQKVPAEKYATHHFSFDQFIEAYDTFARASETKALKVGIAA